jgi:hypothetical protein
MSEPVCCDCKKPENNELGLNGMVQVELRPYGPGGAWICYDCAMGSDERKAIAEQNLAARFDAIEQAGKTIMLTEHGIFPFESKES